MWAQMVALEAVFCNLVFCLAEDQIAQYTHIDVYIYKYIYIHIYTTYIYVNMHFLLICIAILDPYCPNTDSRYSNRQIQDIPKQTPGNNIKSIIYIYYLWKKGPIGIALLSFTMGGSLLEIIWRSQGTWNPLLTCARWFAVIDYERDHTVFLYSFRCCTPCNDPLVLCAKNG